MKVKVRDVMSTDVVTIAPDTPLKEAAVLMRRHRVSGLPVVEGDRLVGIVTESDFVARLARDGDTVISLILRRHPPELEGTVRETMTPDPVTIGADESVTLAARTMAQRRVKRLPVVDGSGGVIGIVSRADLMGIFARPDDRIAADIVSGGVVGLLGAARESVSVAVSDGIVTLSGTVGSVTEKRMLEEFTRQVPGVVAVTSHLVAAFDETRLPPM